MKSLEILTPTPPDRFDIPDPEVSPGPGGEGDTELSDKTCKMRYAQVSSLYLGVNVPSILVRVN